MYKRSNHHFLFVLVLIFIFSLSLLHYAVNLNPGGSQKSSVEQINQVDLKTLEGMNNDKTIVDVKDVATRTYSEKDLGWEIEYKDDLEINVGPGDMKDIGNMVSFARSGPSQAEGTGFHDGFLMKISQTEKNKGSSLEEYARDSSYLGYEEVPQPIEKTTINGVEGFRAGILNSEVTFLPYNNSSDRVIVIHIYYGGELEDQYKDESRKMLNSFKLITQSKSL